MIMNIIQTAFVRNHIPVNIIKIQEIPQLIMIIISLPCTPALPTETAPAGRAGYT